MPTRMSRRQAARLLTHALQRIADPSTPDSIRERLEGHAAFYRKALVGYCHECGRHIDDQSQPGYALGLGPECYSRRLDEADIMDRAYDRAQAHELSFR